MRIVIFLISVFFFSLGNLTSLEANLYREVSCNIYGAEGTTCDQCFDGGGKYAGDTFAPYDFFNAGSQDRIYFGDENSRVYEVRTLNNRTTWFTSNNLLRYPSNLNWFTQTSSGRNYLHFQANTSTRFLETVPGRGVQLQSVNGNPSNVNPNSPAMKFTFISTYRTFQNNNLSGPTTHRECIFYQPRYCGDGILQTDKGEVCDPNDPQRRGFGSGGCDAHTCQPISNPTCNALTVTPNSGDAPLNVSAVCTGFNVNTWQIDCGNGQTFTGNGNNGGNQSFTRTCNYTTAGNFTPRCTINGSITNNSCQKTVHVTNPLNPSIVIDKRDANIHDLDGVVGNDTQTVYRGERAVFRIRVTNNGSEILQNIRLTDAQAPACATSGQTTVDLQNNRFTNIDNQVITITQGGSGNRNDARLEPGEWFEYTCEKTDTQANYTNTAGTTGVGVTTGRTVSDTDPSHIRVVAQQVPRIEVDKRDANPNDLDGNIGGNDSQTVVLGDQAIFSITVTNNGSEDLRNITLTDERAPACATAPGTFVDLQNGRFTNRENQVINISYTGPGNHNDAILQVGEKFSYTCARSNTQQNYTNVVVVGGVGVNSNTPVTDDDSTQILVERNPSIRIIKLDANPNDLDLVQFNDTQTVIRGAEAVFQIRVVNNGSEDLRNLVLTDERAPACATAQGTFVDLQNGRFTNRLGEVITINVSGSGNNTNAIFERNEEFFYTCNEDDTQQNYTNVVSVVGTGVTSGQTVQDEDDTEVLIRNEAGGIDLIKSKAPGQGDNVAPGDIVNYIMTVRNRSNVRVENLMVEDHFPVGLELDDSTWSLVVGATRVARFNQTFSLDAGTERQIPIRFRVAQNASGTLRNLGVVCPAGDPVCDPETPPTCEDPGEEGTPEGCEEVVVEACIGLTATPSSARNSLTSTLTCTGNNATSFRIEVRNSAGNIVNTINTASGQVTLGTVGNYSASCFVNNETTAIPACTRTLSVTTGGGGGGSDFSCNEIIRNGNSYRCVGTGQQMNQFGITYDIPNETEKQTQVAPARDTTTVLGRRFADFTLPSTATNVQCYSANVGDINRVGLGDTWRTSNQCIYRPGGGGGGGPICGDGIINQPTEECDLGSLNGQPGSTCSADCKIPRTTSIPRCADLPAPLRCSVETLPDEGVYTFGPSGTIVIGHNRNPLYELRGIPSLKNNSNYDIAFDRICVSSDPDSGTETSSMIINDGSLTNAEICVNIEGRKIYPYEELFIVRQGDNYVVRNQYSTISRDDQNIYPTFLGNKDGIPASVRDYGTANIKTSVYSRVRNNQGNLESFSFYHTFLSSNVDVRVARPAVSTVGGGTSYVKSTTTSDVANVTQGIAGMIGNTNFVGTSVSESGVSSDAATVTDTDASSGDRGMQGGITLINPTTTSTNFVSYNGIDNVFVKSGNHTFSSTPTGNGARTYIVENGDVTITGNIETNDNIAIIVRNGNIRIAGNVTQINATLMVLGTGNISGESSNNQLRVIGALYGNIDELVSNRYYIDGSGNNLSVGTIVSFGSNLLRRPAPLLSQFVGEYLESQRVAR